MSWWGKLQKNDIRLDFGGPQYFNNNVTLGSSAKTNQHLVRGRLKLDQRPSGGSTEDYAFQIRSNSAKTSGTHWGIDSETHLKGSGTASIRGVQGVAVLDSTYTSTAGTLVGTYGQARADGTFNAAGGFMTGLYGLIEASAAITASHVCSCWLDSHQAAAVTGSHQLLYMTNNGAATLDEAIFLYGGDKITNFVNFDTCAGMVANATGESMTVTTKIKIKVGEDTLYLQAGTMA